MKKEWQYPTLLQTNYIELWMYTRHFVPSLGVSFSPKKWSLVLTIFECVARGNGHYRRTANTFRFSIEFSDYDVTIVSKPSLRSICGMRN